MNHYVKLEVKSKETMQDRQILLKFAFKDSNQFFGMTWSSPEM